MNRTRSCARTPEVLAARGSLSAELRRHLAACPACADAALAGSHLDALAADLAPRARLSDPGRLYWRARLRSRAEEARRASERATWPIRVLDRLSWALGALVAVGLVARQWPRLAGWARELRGSLPEIAVGNPSPEAVALAAGGLLLALLLYAVYSVWAEE